MDSQLPSFVPILKEHWRINSLYGLLEAAGRFNLSSAWDMSRLVDGWAASTFDLCPPPQAANLTAFMKWALTLPVESLEPCPHVLRIVLEVARRDGRKVGAAWLEPWLKWCPICAGAGTHLVMHQHKAVMFCPTHNVHLLTQCGYCGASSPYRVQRNSSLFQCTHCGERINGGDDSLAALFVSCEREDPADTGLTNIRSSVEAVHIPGLPECRDAGGPSRRAGLLAQDLRILHAELGLEQRLRSEPSKILARYFRFTDPKPEQNGENGWSNDYDRGIFHVLQQVGTLAMLTGHSCASDAAGTWEENGNRDCPCGAGTRLWLRRSKREVSGKFAACSGIQREEYEASHLGLCLSAAWFASVQASFDDDPDVYRSHIQLLEPWISELNLNPESPVGETGRVALLDHRFQWFAVRCTHRSSRILRRQRQLESIVRAPRSHTASVLDDVRWLTL